MRPKRFVSLPFVIVVITLLIMATNIDFIKAGSQGFLPRNGLRAVGDTPVTMVVLPGVGPVKDENYATALGMTIASTSLAEGSTTDVISHIETKKLNRSEYTQILQKNGSSINISSFSKSETQEIWVVTFSGSFSPDHIPYGVKVPIYSRIDVLIKGENGEVAGVHMYD